jgi:hypothetical protein
MEMRFLLMGLAAKIPHTRIGLNAVSGCFIHFRYTPKSDPIEYVIFSGPSVGEETGTLIVGYVKTDWVPLMNDKSHPLPNLNTLAGKKVEVSAEGMFAVSGHVDINFLVYNDTGDTISEIHKVDIKAHGAQFSSTTIRGQIRWVPPKPKFAHAR